MQECDIVQRILEAARAGSTTTADVLSRKLSDHRGHLLACDTCSTAYGALLATYAGASPPDVSTLGSAIQLAGLELLGDDEPITRRRAARALAHRSGGTDETDALIAGSAPCPDDYRHIALLASASLRQGPMSSLARLVRELGPYLMEHKPSLYVLEDSYRLMLHCGLLRDYPPELLHCLAPVELGGLIDLGAGLVGRPVAGLEGVLGADTDQIAIRLGLDWTIDCVVYLVDSLDPTSLTPETTALKRECAVTRRPFLDTYTSAVEFFGLLGGEEMPPGVAYTNSIPDLLREPLGYASFPHDVLALIAHDSNKERLLEFVRENIEFLARFEKLIGPASTAALLNGALPEHIDVPEIQAARERLVRALCEHGVELPWVDGLAHGRDGGNLQIAESVAMGACDCVILLEEPRPLAEYGVTSQLVERSARMSNHPDRLGESGKQMLLHDPRSAAVWAQLWGRADPGGPVTLETAFRELFGVELVLAAGDWDEITDEAAWYVLSALATSRAAGGGTGEETRVSVACGRAMADVLGKIDAVALELCRRIADHHERYSQVIADCQVQFPRFARRIEQLARRRKLMLEAAPDNAALWSIGPVVVAPIVGRFGCAEDDVEATTIARALAASVAGRSLGLDANAFTRKACEVPRELTRHWATTDLAVITCADLQRHWFRAGSKVALQPGMYEDLVEQEASGEIAGLYLDASGHEVRPTGYRRQGMSVAELQRVASAGSGSAAIIVAGATVDGEEPPARAQTVRAALRAGVASVLVSDPAFATAVLAEEAAARGYEQLKTVGRTPGKPRQGRRQGGRARS